MAEQRDRRSGLDHAFGAVDDVRRRHWRHRRHHRPPVFIGVAFLALGVLFLLDNLNVLETRNLVRNFWPVLLIVWGSVRLVSGQGGERIMGATAAVVGGLFLGNRLFGWDLNVMAVFWPLVLIAFGISILSRAWGRVPATGASGAVSGTSSADGVSAGEGAGRDDAGVDTSSTVKEFAVMAGVKRENVSQTFRGGDVTAVMGSVEIDLRECRMASDEVQVGVFVLMGEAVFRIPRDWTVDSRVAAVLGNFEDRSAPPVGATTKRFVVLGSAVMGNVEIRN